nr:uncharacterized protein LOC125625747 [Caretta caretta]
MACHLLLKKDIVTLCKKRGLSVGKFTKAELIVQLEEDDRSKEQIPDPSWGYSRIWEQLERQGLVPAGQQEAQGPSLADRRHRAVLSVPGSGAAGWCRGRQAAGSTRSQAPGASAPSPGKQPAGKRAQCGGQAFLRTDAGLVGAIAGCGVHPGSCPVGSSCQWVCLLQGASEPGRLGAGCWRELNPAGASRGGFGTLGLWETRPQFVLHVTHCPVNSMRT